MVWFIQGCFVCEDSGLGLAFDDHGDVQAVIQRYIGQFMFSGIIFPEPHNLLNDLIGQMWDNYGYSDLTKVDLMPDSLTFVKKYKNRPDTIRYTFRREGTIWIGGFEGETTGSGGANCIITEIPDEFFVFQPVIPARSDRDVFVLNPGQVEEVVAPTEGGGTNPVSDDDIPF